MDMNQNSFVCELHVRISQADIHYAGNLVDGAHIMKLFGDVATQLTIQIDGDEGLLRAYENVEFLAPVHGGDFLLIRGNVTKIGKSSRQIVFEAYKTIQGGTGEFPSSCTILDPPLLVAKASGTSIVTKNKQKN